MSAEMSKETALVVVESPAKARTIKKYLGPAYVVKASVGHVKDLPKSKIGVDLENGFQPEYVVIRGKKKVLQEIRKSAKEADKVYLAPDPDREGEAIAWHIAEEIRDVNTEVYRVLINEITKKGITEALRTPGRLDVHKFESQQARRVLDRLVGYKISPILWRKVRRGLSAGRVQSVAVRIVVEREREILAFQPEEYWTVDATCRGQNPPSFSARLSKWNGEKVNLAAAAQVEGIASELRRQVELSAAGSAPGKVESVERKERRRHPAPPFITSKLQQEAARKLRFSAKRTMALAQRLYEGLDLGEEGPVGLITYMRTDSVRVSEDALAEARTYIGQRFGGDYLPPQPNYYRSSKQAQDAHEAIRPTSMRFDPETVRRLLLGPAAAKRKDGESADRAGERTGAGREGRDHEDCLKLYALVWNRFVASQMTSALYEQTAVEIASGPATLRATGQLLRFPGYTRVYLESENDDEAAQKAEEQDRLLPLLTEGEPVFLDDVRPEQHFTQPPPRFSEASLVKELEEKGIGRPSTYATILSTIQERGYSEKREGRFHPTELGMLVNDLLVDAFPDILSVGFTARMEEDLDMVEEGRADWVKVLTSFYGPFESYLTRAESTMRDVKREEIPTEHKCEKCGSPMVIKWGRNGSFLACSGYPDCKNTKEFVRRPDGSVEVIEERTTDERCEVCGAEMKVKRGRFGEFLACSRSPDCKTTKPISLGVSCPRSGCGGFLTEKRSKRGRVFYGCSSYAKTKCDFVTWDRPYAGECPQCGGAALARRETKRGLTIRCLAEGCGYIQSETDASEEDASQ
ncbi:MAG: type I DNA topoisomerase [Pseudomonadota bacterium]